MSLSKNKSGRELDAELIVPIIKPVLRDDEEVDLHLAPEEQPLSDEFVGDLCILYAFDLPDCFQFVTQSDCERLRLQPDRLRGVAETNLRRILPPIERHGEPPAFMLTAGGNLEASLLLLDDLWESQQEVVPGELIAAAPARDVLLFTGSESPEGLRAIKSSILRVLGGGDHLLSKSVFVRRGNRWELFGGGAI